MSYSYAFASCMLKTNANEFCMNVNRGGYNRLVNQGDLIYITGRINTWNVHPSTPIGEGTVSADMQPYFEQAHACPGMQELIADSFPMVYLPDDHAWTGDNWCHTVACAEDGNPGNTFTTQTQVDASFNEGRLTYELVLASTWGGNYVNETNTDDNVGPEKPSSADAATSVNNYPVHYFKTWKDVSDTTVTSNPHTVHIYLDNISHRSDITATDNASKTMMGSIQKQWLKDQLLAAKNNSASFVLIWSGKKLFNSALSDNIDTYDAYQTERTEVLDYIDSISLTGVVWLSGDKHRHQIISLKTDDGDSHDVFNMVACPASIDLNGAQSNADGGIIWLAGGAAGTFFPGYGAVHIEQSRVITEIRHGITDKVIQRWISTPSKNYAEPTWTS